MFFRRPFAHVHPDLRQHGLHHHRAEAVDRGEINAGQAIEIKLQIEIGVMFVPPVIAALELWGRVAEGVELPGQLAINFFDLFIASLELLRVKVVQFKGLLELKNVRRLVITLQRFGDDLLIFNNT